MAALSDQHAPLVELRNLGAAQLAQVLQEEIADWRSGLNWDFNASAELVRRFVDMRALTGFALLDGAQVAGYSYYVCEEGKGLIGDLYVRAPLRTPEREGMLLAAVLDAMWHTPGAKRMEGQLLMLGSPLKRPVPYAHWFRAYPRLFLEASLADVGKLPAREPVRTVIQPWSESRQEEAAWLIAAAYSGHIDAEINDQYRTPAGARRFLNNIVQYPGCGTFFAPASYLAEEYPGGAMCGLCLASVVAPGVGHVTQVCVTPAYKRTGLGYELLRRSLLAMAAHGCRSVSLTVTASNLPAIRLYERVGFRNLRNFSAYVWEKR